MKTPTWRRPASRTLAVVSAFGRSAGPSSAAFALAAGPAIRIAANRIAYRAVIEAPLDSKSRGCDLTKASALVLALRDRSGGRACNAKQTQSPPLTREVT